MPPKGASGPSGAQFLGLGVMLAAMVVIPMLGGAVLDRVTGTGPLFLLIGLVGGIAAASLVMYTRLVKPYL